MQTGDGSIYGPELRFGEIMLKLAGRELERLYARMAGEVSEQELAELRCRYAEFSAEVESFASELQAYQTDLSTGN